MLRLRDTVTGNIVGPQITIPSDAEDPYEAIIPIPGEELVGGRTYRLWCQNVGGFADEIGLVITDDEGEETEPLLEIFPTEITAGMLQSGQDVGGGGDEGGGFTIRAYCGQGIEYNQNPDMSMLASNSELLGELEVDMYKIGMIGPGDQSLEFGLNLKLKAIPAPPSPPGEECAAASDLLNNLYAQREKVLEEMAKIQQQWDESDCESDSPKDPEFCANLQDMIAQGYKFLQDLEIEISEIEMFLNSCGAESGWSARESTCSGSRLLTGIVPSSPGPYPTRMGPAGDKWHCSSNSPHLSRWFTSSYMAEDGSTESSCERSIFITCEWGANGDGWVPNDNLAYDVSLTQLNMKVHVPVCGPQLLEPEECNVQGCTDPNACNYNPDATIDDGSCYFGDDCWDGSSTCNDPCGYEGCPGPQAPDIGMHTIDEDTSLSLGLTDWGAGGQGAQWSNSSPENGTVVWDAEIQGKFVYTPNADWNGIDSFTYTIVDQCDPPNTASGVVEINVIPVSDGPPNAIIEVQGLYDSDGNPWPRTCPIECVIDCYVEEAVNITLDASSSNDPDGGVLDYLWEQGLAGGDEEISNSNSVMPFATQPMPGMYYFILTVTDNIHDESDIETVYFNIISPTILGCTDSAACNYDETATDEDGSCLYGIDCAGVCGGGAVEDCFGVCGGDAVVDCDGICGGDAVVDECGVCNGPGPLTCWDGSMACDEAKCPDADVEKDVAYNIDGSIIGFQFNISGGTIINAYGGAAQEAGFLVSGGGSTVIGFSPSGGSIPAGSGITLVRLTIKRDNPTEPCVISDSIILGPADQAATMDAMVDPDNCWKIIGTTQVPLMVEGCTDPNACNYDSMANTADRIFDLCMYTDECGNCLPPGDEGWKTLGTNPGDLCNCDTGAIVDHCGVCGGTGAGWECWNGNFVCDEIDCPEEPVEVMGCTNPAASNYNSNATVDDGSCMIHGCTNPTADNWNPAATHDDGSCIIHGCTDPMAANWNPAATHDDGTCQGGGGAVDITFNPYDYNGGTPPVPGAIWNGMQWVTG